MTELKDLLVLHNFEVRKVDGEVRARLNKRGNYRAACIKDVEDMLNTGQADGDVFVRLHTWGKWQLVKP